MDIVNERLDSIKMEVMKLQRPTHYAEAFKNFTPVVNEEVPEELQNSWIDELTIRTFNEELKNVFPYIYNLVKEKKQVEEVSPEDLLGEVSDMGMNKYGLAAKHEKGKFYSYKDGKMTGGPFDSIEELEAHQQELIKDEASGYEGGDEAHAHAIDIDGDYDEDRGISEKDCEEMQYELSKSGIKATCEPDEMRQGGVIVHTMSPRDAVIDALDKAGYQANETLSPEDEFESELSNIVGETEDALIDGQGADQQAAIKKLNGLMASEFQAGVNGNNAVMSLKGVIDDPLLLDMFKQVGQKESSTDVRPLVMKYIKAKAPSILSKIDTGDMATEDRNTGIKDKEDYQAKKKAIQDIQMDPNTHKDEKLKKEIMRRKAELDSEAKEKGYKEGEDDIAVKMNPDGSIEKAKEDKRKPSERLEELVKSHYDYTSNSFPKGETAIVTACEKEFGDKAIPFAEKMIARLKQGKDREMERIKHLAGV